MYYFDTSALVKLYHTEIGSDIIIKLFEETSNGNFISELALVEFYSALFAKLRNKEIADERTAQAIIVGFEQDMQAERILKLNSTILSGAKNMLKRFGATHSLKTYDALHLATFEEIAIAEPVKFVSADSRLCKIAYEMGFNTIDPLHI